MGVGSMLAEDHQAVPGGGLRAWQDILSKASYQYQVTMRLYVCTRDNVKKDMLHAHSRTSDY